MNKYFILLMLFSSSAFAKNLATSRLTTQPSLPTVDELRAWSALERDSFLFAAVDSDNAEGTQRALEAGADLKLDVNKFLPRNRGTQNSLFHIAKSGLVALSLAVYAQKQKLDVKTLMAKTDEDGRTPLFYAHRASVAMVWLELGADPFQKDKYGNTADQIVENYGDRIEIQTDSLNAALVIREKMSELEHKQK